MGLAINVNYSNGSTNEKSNFQDFNCQRLPKERMFKKKDTDLIEI